MEFIIILSNLFSSILMSDGKSIVGNILLSLMIISKKWKAIQYKLINNSIGFPDHLSENICHWFESLSHSSWTMCLLVEQCAPSILVQSLCREFNTMHIHFTWKPACAYVWMYVYRVHIFSLLFSRVLYKHLILLTFRSIWPYVWDNGALRVCKSVYISWHLFYICKYEVEVSV